MPSYEFLNFPPPAAPLPALPTRRRSFSTISNWAQGVHPGSPAPRSPVSPRRSIVRRASISRRRPSIGHGRAPSSASFLHLIDTPTTASSKDIEFDLRNLGYTSLFLHLPQTPSTPAHLKAQTANLETISPSLVKPSSPRGKPSALKRIRSLGLLKPLRGRSKAKSVSRPGSPTKSSIKAPKKAQKEKPKDLPPSLTNELMLMQFMGGGTLESQAEAYMKSQAKVHANATHSSKKVVCGVYRDVNGTFWRDEAEKVEYTRLLNGDHEPADLSAPASPASSGGEWVGFAPTEDKEKSPSGERRGSLSSQTTDVEAECPIKIDSIDNLVLSSSSRMLVGKDKSKAIIAIPVRSKRSIKPQEDLNAFAVHHLGAAQRKRGKERRRPAPLKIVQASAFISGVRACGQKDFFSDSFRPLPRIPSSAPATSMNIPIAPRSIMKKYAILNA